MYDQKYLTFRAKYFIKFLHYNKRYHIFAVSKLTTNEKRT